MLLSASDLFMLKEGSLTKPLLLCFSLILSLSLFHASAFSPHPIVILSGGGGADASSSTCEVSAEIEILGIFVFCYD